MNFLKTTLLAVVAMSSQATVFADTIPRNLCLDGLCLFDSASKLIPLLKAPQQLNTARELQKFPVCTIQHPFARIKTASGYSADVMFKPQPGAPRGDQYYVTKIDFSIPGNYTKVQVEELFNGLLTKFGMTSEKLPGRNMGTLKTSGRMFSLVVEQQSTRGMFVRLGEHRDSAKLSDQLSAQPECNSKTPSL